MGFWFQDTHFVLIAGCCWSRTNVVVDVSVAQTIHPDEIVECLGHVAGRWRLFIIDIHPFAPFFIYFFLPFSIVFFIRFFVLLSALSPSKYPTGIVNLGRMVSGATTPRNLRVSSGRTHWSILCKGRNFASWDFLFRVIWNMRRMGVPLGRKTRRSQKLCSWGL